MKKSLWLVVMLQAFVLGADEGGETKTQLSGVVFYRLKSGESLILRGLNIYVVDESEVRNNPGIVVDSATLKITAAMAEVLGDCSRVTGGEKLIAKSATYKATTNIDAKYSFQGLAEGDYHVFAFLNSSAANGVWDIAVKLRDQPVKLDLDNSNISAVCDVSTP